MSLGTHTIVHRGHDHFEPEIDTDLHDQRRRKARLEAIDYAASAANAALLPDAVGALPIETFERLALTVAAARGRWLALATAMAEVRQPSPEAVAGLSEARLAYEELCMAYEGLRRLVERGHVRQA